MTPTLTQGPVITQKRPQSSLVPTAAPFTVSSAVLAAERQELRISGPHGKGGRTGSLSACRMRLQVGIGTIHEPSTRSMKTPQWRTEGNVSYIVPFVDAGLVAPSGKKWKAILLTLTDDYHMGMQGMKRQVYRFSKRENAMKGLETHVRQLHPDVGEIRAGAPVEERQPLTNQVP